MIYFKIKTIHKSFLISKQILLLTKNDLKEIDDLAYEYQSYDFVYINQNDLKDLIYPDHFLVVYKIYNQLNWIHHQYLLLHQMNYLYHILN